MRTRPGGAWVYSPKWTVRILAALCVGLAAICLAMAVGDHRLRAEAACWRSLAEREDWPPEGQCSSVGPDRAWLRRAVPST